jgi:hypothetical protein
MSRSQNQYTNLSIGERGIRFIHLIKELIMEFNKYVRRPFSVEAIQITKENIEEVAKLVGTYHVKDGVGYISLDRRIVPLVKRAYLGWWITFLDDTYRCYTSKLFKSQFIDQEPVMAWSFEEGNMSEIMDREGWNYLIEQNRIVDA